MGVKSCSSYSDKFCEVGVQIKQVGSDQAECAIESHTLWDTAFFKAVLTGEMQLFKKKQ